MLLAIGQVLYGPLMGFGYPLAVLSGGGDTVSPLVDPLREQLDPRPAVQARRRFRLQGDTTTYVARPAPGSRPERAGLRAGRRAGRLSAVRRLARPGPDSLARRSIEFSLAILTMLLVSPHTAQDYLVTALPVLAVWLYLWSQRTAAAVERLGQTALGRGRRRC